MKKELFSMLDRRKSQRSFSESLSEEDMRKAESIAEGLESLTADRCAIRILDRRETSSPKGDKCILFYSDNSVSSHLNAGYMLEQFDLEAEMNGLGVCWYGFGRTKEKTADGLDFTVMEYFGKGVDLRTGENDFSRIPADAFWKGDGFDDVKRLVRLAPSACNSQPWLVRSEGNLIHVSRGEGKPSLMRGMIKRHFNLIDMGIFLCFLELSLEGLGYSFERRIIAEEHDIAEYFIR